jgi:hypothetical protein
MSTLALLAETRVPAIPTYLRTIYMNHIYSAHVAT